jgi:hypothetical protein
VINILEFWKDFGLYSLWLYTLALNLASSLILINHYIKSRGTPIGRTAFYFFLNSFWWSVTSVIVTFPIIITTDFSVSYFYLFFPFLASIASILGTYERTRIQMLLTPGAEKQTRDNRLWFILSLCTFSVALVGVIGVILNNSTLNIIFKGMGGLTCLSFVLIGGLFIALTLPKFRISLVYGGSAILLIVGFTVIIGTMLQIPTLYSPLPGAPTNVPTALVFIIVGSWVATAKLPGIKWWIVRIVNAFAILSTFVLVVVTILGLHPQVISYALLLLIMLVGGALLWRSWKIPIL